MAARRPSRFGLRVDSPCPLTTLRHGSLRSVTMDLRIFTEPQQGASHATLLAAARTTQEAGFSAFFRSDHVLSMGSGPGLPGPSDSVASLAALAAQVPDIRLGTLVTSATFRH